MVRGGVLMALVAVLVVAAVVVVIMSRHHGSQTATGRPTASGSTVPSTLPATAPGSVSAASGSVGAAVPSQPPATASLQVPVAAPSEGAAAGVPRRLRVPAIGVDTSLQPLGLLKDGSLQAPSKWQQAGWYAKGTRPGDVGPAVIAGHVDSYLGPAVFYRLRELKTGDDLQVQSAPGRWQHFTVTAVQRFAKSDFPTQVVYGPTPLAELKLITCTGDFDRSKRSYVDNLVVTAVLAPAAGVIP